MKRTYKDIATAHARALERRRKRYHENRDHYLEYKKKRYREMMAALRKGRETK